VLESTPDGDDCSRDEGREYEIDHISSFEVGNGGVVEDDVGDG